MKKLLPVLLLLSTIAVDAQQYITKKNIHYYPDSVSKKDAYINTQCTLDVYYPKGTKNVATIVWFHGGGLTGGNKEIPKALMDKGYAIIGVEYRLSPKAKAPAYIEDAAAATAWVFQHIATYGGSTNLVFISGHSAGGYRTALHRAADWDRYGLPPEPLAGAVPISGVFDVRPLIRTSMNEALRLDPASAAALDLLREPVRSAAPLALFVGGDESAEFHAQSDALAAAWADLDPRVVDVPGRNHFDVIEGLADPGSELNRTIVAMIERR